MKTHYLLIILSLSLLTCSRNSEDNQPGNTSRKKIRKQVTAVAEKYIMSQLTDPERILSENGTITIGDKQKRYVIEPSKIYTGFIDEDANKDAIVSLSVFQGQYQTVSEQLIILKADKDFILARTLESDMKIISLEDRIITADVPEHSRNTPLFDCQSCWEVVKFRFKTGELVRME